MDVDVTVYLKNEMSTKMNIKNTTLEDQAEVYGKAFDGGKRIQLINHMSPTSIEMIPVENVALIQIKEAQN